MRLLIFALLLCSSIYCGYSQNPIDDILDEAWALYESSPEKSLKLLDEALVLSKKARDEKRELEALEMKGIVYDELDYSNQAVEIYLEVLERRKLRKEEEYFVSLYLNLGIVYEKMEQFKQALEYFDLAKQLSEEHKDKEGIILSSINLGTTYSEIGNTEECVSILNHLLKEYEIDSTTKVAIYTDRGLAHQRNGNYEYAYSDYQLAIDYLDGLTPSREVIVLSNLGKLYRQMDSLDQSKVVLKNCFKLSSDLSDFTSMAFSSNELSLVYDQEKTSPDSALLWLKQSKLLADSLARSRDDRYINTLNTVYKVQEQEDQINSLEQDQLKKQNRLVWIISTSIITALTLLLLLLIYRNRFKQKKKEQEIQALVLIQKEQELKKYKSDLRLRTENLLEKTRMLRTIQLELDKTKDLKQKEIQQLQNRILTQQDWDQYRNAFKQVYPHFLENLKKKSTELTQGEKRTAVLLKQDLSNSEIADILGISERSVIQNKYRLRKKLGFEEVDELIHFLQSS